MISKEQCTDYVKSRLLRQNLQVYLTQEPGADVLRFGPPGCGSVGSITLVAIHSDDEAALKQLDAMIAEALTAAADEPALRAKS